MEKILWFIVSFGSIPKLFQFWVASPFFVHCIVGYDCSSNHHHCHKIHYILNFLLESLSSMYLRGKKCKSFCSTVPSSVLCSTSQQTESATNKQIIYVGIHMQVFMRMQYPRIYIWICMHVKSRTPINLCACVCVCAYVRACVCVCSINLEAGFPYIYNLLLYFILFLSLWRFVPDSSYGPCSD